MHFLSFSPKYSLQYLIVHAKVGNMFLIWAFINKGILLTRRNSKHQKTSMWQTIPLVLPALCIFRERN